MQKIEFSVLLSVYKNESREYLRECFNSIYKNQTLKPSEIVLVEDGLLTNELYSEIEILKKELGKILKIVKLEKNMRLGNALRIGIENCTYEIIARMDTDDIARSDRFEKQIAYMVENPDIGVVGSYMAEFSQSINKIVAIKKAPLSNFKNYMKLRDPVNHPSVMFRKQEVLTAGNYIEILYNEDSYLWARMLANGSLFANIPETLVYFRVSDDTYKRRGGWNYVLSEYKLQRLLLKLEIINKFEFLRNIVIKNIVRLLPNFIRKKIYIIFLRSK